MEMGLSVMCFLKEREPSPGFSDPHRVVDPDIKGWQCTAEKNNRRDRQLERSQASAMMMNSGMHRIIRIGSNWSSTTTMTCFRGH